MKFLVIGLGSMGKRRIRCLKELGYEEIYGVDIRDDRRRESVERHAITTFSNVESAIAQVEPDIMIISVPPDQHHHYMKIAIQHNKHFFVEASVVDTEMDVIIESLRGKNIVAAPSATFVFHPAIQIIGDLVKSGELGKLSNAMLHSGQYLPDWHTYEAVSDYYVSNPATGGGREIVPFELTWFTKVFGFPKRVCGNFRKTIEIVGAEQIDDTYNCLLDYGDFLATVTVDVVSRHATRRMLINASKKQVVWNWDDACVQVFEPDTAQWRKIPYEMKGAANGYNENIGENMYIEELRAFVSAVEGEAAFVNSMSNDHNVLKLLYAIEEADEKSCYVEVSR